MIQETSGVYQLQFWRTFGAPVGAILEYAGMAKWLYRDPSTGETLSFSDSQANSYARDTGGMKGTHWKVIGVVKDGAEIYLVTLDPAYRISIEYSLQVSASEF